MPYLSGLELCRALKNDLKTSHIPIILLTARTAIEQKIEGIETGADDYIEKPFHFRLLEARIKNILKSREKLRERYRNEIILKPTAVSAVSTDEIFLVKIKHFIEEHLSDSELEIKQLSSEAGLSRTNLFLKLKDLTGYSPRELIKTIRLEKAAQLLLQTDITISEIAYQVGFKYPKYFSTCFCQRFGMTPSEYRTSVPLLN
jgi:AraC-like DNA-binding protein